MLLKILLQRIKLLQDGLLQKKTARHLFQRILKRLFDIQMGNDKRTHSLFLHLPQGHSSSQKQCSAEKQQCAAP